MSGKFPYDIFISYSQKDREAAVRLQAAFEARGLKVWRDPRLLDNPEASFIGKINEALERSAKVVVLWSRNSVNSTWVHGEAERARMAGRVVPLALEPIGALLPYIPSPFNILPTLDASADPVVLEPVLRALGAQQVEGQPEGVLTLVTADVDISKLPDTYAKKLYGRDREMAALVSAWDNANTRIFAFDAMGGAGKTALVYHFVQALKASGWRGARSVFAWSFYSQGSNEDRQTSADDFFRAAYKHFGGEGKEPPRDPHQKGVDLAHLVQGQRALLILDGMEPLQYAAGARGGSEKTTQVGGIKDPGVKALLSLLSDNNPGLCIVTTRIKLAELEGAEGVTFEELSEIPLMPAIELLRDLGVEPDFPPSAPSLRAQRSNPDTTDAALDRRGAEAPRDDGGRAYKLPRAEEFKALVPPYPVPAGYAPPAGDDRPAMPALVVRDMIEAVKELKGHALALTLVGRFLAEHHHGDIRAIHDLPDLAHLDPAAKERAPYRVMRAIEIALANRIAEMDASEKPADVAAGRQLALLFFLGFFDRPAERELLPVVFSDAAAEIAPDPADIALAATDLIAIERRLWELDEELHGGSAPEWRRKEIERDKKPLAAKRNDIIEARRRVLVRRLFAGMHAYLGEEGQITNALSQLAAQGLVSRTDEKEAWKRASIDCHPLVREYFGARLKELDRATFRAAHGRLYDHYRYKGLPKLLRTPLSFALIAFLSAWRTSLSDIVRALSSEGGNWRRDFEVMLSPNLLSARETDVRSILDDFMQAGVENLISDFCPDQGDKLRDIFYAILHGCYAERYAEVYLECYFPRIRRGPEHYVSEIGLYGDDLAALACFFKTPYLIPNEGLSNDIIAHIYTLSGFALRSLGRLQDAVEPMRASMTLRARNKVWGGARNDAVNLSEILTALGILYGDDGALAIAQDAQTYAKQDPDKLFEMYAAGANIAYVLYLTGNIAEAEYIMDQARALLADKGEERFNASQDGFQFCEISFGKGRQQDALLWLIYCDAHGLQQSKTDSAFVEHVRAIIAKNGKNHEAIEKIDAALKLYRDANVETLLPKALIEASEISWLYKKRDIALSLLKEAEAIAQRGPMPLYLADTFLMRARFQLSEGSIFQAEKSRNAAYDLIEKHGYGCAAPELAILTAEIACAENTTSREAAIIAAIAAIRGKSYHDKNTGITLDGGWWGLLPRLEALVPASHPELASLRAARDAYNAERDAYLAAEDAKGWGEEDRALADPDFRRALNSALRQGTLDERSLGDQRGLARAFLKQTREAQGEDEASDLPEIPDALLDQFLADANVREAINAMLKEAGIDEPIDRLPREAQQQAVAAFLAILQKTQEDEATPSEAPPAARPQTSSPPEPPAGKKGGGWWPFGRKT